MDETRNSKKKGRIHIVYVIRNGLFSASIETNIDIFLQIEHSIVCFTILFFMSVSSHNVVCVSMVYYMRCCNVSAFARYFYILQRFYVSSLIEKGIAQSDLFLLCMYQKTLKIVCVWDASDSICFVSFKNLWYGDNYYLQYTFEWK